MIEEIRASEVNQANLNLLSSQALLAIRYFKIYSLGISSGMVGGDPLVKSKLSISLFYIIYRLVKITILIQN